ncbi:carotenoid oxygenase [Xylariaceae sp. FL0594]|nr:carotenoid oxygenase [Xylariaceae sp. FL0594]
MRAIKESGRPAPLSFGQRQDPCVGIFAKAMSLFRSHETPAGEENICVTVQPDIPGFAPVPETTISGHRAAKRTMFQTTDASMILEIEPDTMEPIGVARQRKLHPLLKGPLSCAHAQRDPQTGDLFNYNLEPGRVSTYRVFRTSATTGQTDIIATISMPDVKPAYIHSFCLTPSFVVFCVPSTHLAFMGISVPWNGNIIDSIEPFNESKLCKWFVIDRHHGRGVIATAESPAGFFFHSVNAFEERDAETGDITVFCDVIEYPSTDILRSFEMDALLLGNKGNYTDTYRKGEEYVRDCQSRFARHQFKVPGANTGDKAVKVDSEKILEFKAPYAGELPTINAAYSTRKYRYFYSMAVRGYSTLQDAIVKTDLITRKTLMWHVEGHTPGEAIFVPRPRQAGDDDEDAEDDGVLLSVILDGFGRKSYLVCIDAKTMQELGRAECDWAVGHGFHGCHVPPIDSSS